MMPDMVEWRKQFLFKFWSCWKFGAPVISPKDRLIKLPERKNFLVERITARLGLSFKRNHDDPRKKLPRVRKKNTTSRLYYVVVSTLCLQFCGMVHNNACEHFRETLQ